MFYLMQHYSKENKEKYKAAKERKKSGNTATEAPVAKMQASVIKPVAAASAVQQPPVSNPYQAAPAQPQAPRPPGDRQTTKTERHAKKKDDQKRKEETPWHG